MGAWTLGRDAALFQQEPEAIPPTRMIAAVADPRTEKEKTGEEQSSQEIEDSRFAAAQTRATALLAVNGVIAGIGGSFLAGLGGEAVLQWMVVGWDNSAGFHTQQQRSAQRALYRSFWRTDSNGTISVNGSAPAGLNPKQA